MSLSLDQSILASARAPRSLARTAVALAFLLAGCSGGTDLLLPGDGEPAAIEVLHGDAQNGRVGEPLSQPLVVLVSDSRGLPVKDAQVEFAFAQAGPGASVVPDTASTDADGTASAQLVLGTNIGLQQGEARVVVPEGSVQPKTTFSATALSENANGIVALSGDDQTGPAGSTLSQSLVVQVTDVFGNPIPGVPINWSPEGGGSVSEASNTTDDQGQASVLRTLGPMAGPQATIAASEGLAGSPVMFIHTATAGNAAVLSIVSGNDQTAAPGTELPGDLVVRLVDAQGNGVPGAGVTWVVGTGGGHVFPENTTTDEAGRTSSRWTLGPTPGQNRVDAVVSGVGVVHFLAIAASSAPPRLAILTQPASSTRNGAVLGRQPVVQARDANGNDVRTAGVEITAQLAGGGGELLGTRQLRTDASGRVAFTDLAIAGAEGTRALVFTAAGYAGVTSTPIDVQAIPTTTTITGDSPDPSAGGALVTVSFQVTAGGVTPIGSVTITDGQQSCTGTLSRGMGNCQLSLSTPGERTLRATYAGAAGLNGSSDTEPHRVEAPAPGNNPPDARFTWTCDRLTCRFSDTSTDSDGSVVNWTWTFGGGGSSSERNPSHTFPAPGTYTVTLAISDDDGAGDQVSESVQVNAPPPPPQDNKAPHAEFEVSCNGLTCSFTDQSRDDDGRIVSRAWDYGDGNTGTQPSHTYAAPGRYEVTLTVTDDDGASDSRTRNADPEAPPPQNQSPTASFSEDCSGLTCAFNSDPSSDPDGNIQTWNWTFGDNGSSSDRNPSHTYPSGGTYTVTLTVTDDDGATDSETHQVTVNAPPPPNQSPTAAFDSDCNELTCSFNSQSSSDSDGGITGWSWTFGDGGASSEQNPSHTYVNGGNYTVTLTVTDDDGATDSESHQVSVTAPNQAPSAEFTSNCTDLSCSFNSSGSSDPDGTIASVSWDFGDGTSSTEANPSHSYDAAGTYDVTLTVTDDDGASDPVTHQVSVSAPNQPPAASLSSSCTGLTCTFGSGGSIDPDGTINGRLWNFGDGSSSTDPNPTHTYPAAGTYTVTLTVTDEKGASDEASDQVTLSAPASTNGAAVART